MIKKYLSMVVLFTLVALGVASWMAVPPIEARGETAPLAQGCTVVQNKTALPASVNVGGVVTVNLTVQASNCDAASSPVDVILVLDRSGSMGGKRITNAKSAAVSFVNNISANDLVGVATFASTGAGRLEQQLTSSKTALTTAINGFSIGGWTNITDGLVVAEQELGTARHIANSIPVIILLSDGYHNSGAVSNLYAVADRIKSNGIRIITIGLGNGVNESQLKQLASSTNDYYYAPTSSDLTNIYQNILGQSLRVAARNMVITDTLSSNVSLIANSFQGVISSTVVGNQIVWNVGQVPTTTISLSYQVAMTKTAGTWDTNASAVASYLSANGSVASLTFPQPKVEVIAACGAPTLKDVTPKWACVNKTQDVTLQGGAFYQSLAASIGTKALTINSSNERTINASLATGLTVGSYDVTVTNQCPAPTGDLSASLSSVFNIYPEPNILSIRPAEGYQDIPSEITVCGEGFAVPGTTAYIQIGNNKIKLDNQATYGDSCLQGTIPSNVENPLITPGTHTVSVEGTCGIATGEYTVLSNSLNDDLFAQEFWVNPGICVLGDDNIEIGLNVHRRGGKSPVPVTVSFYEGKVMTSTKIGDGTIPLLSPRGGTALESIAGTSTSAVKWNPSSGAGEYILYAVIDPNNTVTEDIETNNVVSRTIRVLPGARSNTNLDTVAPVVSAFKVNLGNNTTLNQKINLQITANDTVNPDVPSSGLKDLKIVELLFNESSGIWTPVAESGWLNYTQNISWTLAPQGGLRYLQAWVSDNKANITRYPYQQQVGYVKPCDAISRNGTRVYRETLSVGDILYVEVSSCSGDPDLYIWPPDYKTGGRAPLISNQFGTATEAISWTVPTAGVYQIEVYGYNASKYSINIETQSGTASTTAVGAFYTAGVSNKTMPVRRASGDSLGTLFTGDPKIPSTMTAPVIPIDSVPNVTMGVITPPVPATSSTTTNNSFLPIVIK